MGGSKVVFYQVRQLLSVVACDSMQRRRARDIFIIRTTGSRFVQ